MNTCRSRGARGFTLIELMIVVAIIGILAATAMPVMQRATLRARATERTYMLQTIHKAIEDAYRVGDRFPPVAEGNAVTAALNPPLPYATGKRTFQPLLGKWALLAAHFVIEGDVYYSYEYSAWEANPGCWVRATGDLDGDGQVSMVLVPYTRQVGAYVPGVPVPPAGQEDAATF